MGSVISGFIKRTIALSATFVGVLATLAEAQTSPDASWQWATVTAAGNAAYVSNGDYTGFPGRQVGRVDYDYRIATTQVTVSQFYEFVAAYAPFYRDGDLRSSRFTGTQILPASNNPARDGFVYGSNYANAAIHGVTWVQAARFVNWLENGKIAAPWAFETGAYDLTRLTVTPGGTYVFSGPTPRSSSARYFLPSQDEWLKAAFYDPSRTGGERYWTYANGSDTPPIEGLPGIGEVPFAGMDPFSLPVGSYPTTNRPWGILDVVGSGPEWTDSVFSLGGALDTRLQASSFTGALPSFITGSIEYQLAQNGSVLNGSGFRIGSVVPAPPAGILFLLSAIAIPTQSRRREYNA